MSRKETGRLYERLCKLLAQARKDAGFTQVELSGRLERPQSYVSKYERGERRLDVVEFLQVAEAIGIDPKDVLDELGR